MTNSHAPRPTLDQEAVRTHFRVAVRYRTPTALWTAIADIPVLLAELERVLDLLTRARTEFANLLAAARVTLAASDQSETDALIYLRDEVEAHRAVERDDEVGRT